jgi:hypothetical protein
MKLVAAAAPNVVVGCRADSGCFVAVTGHLA